MSNHPYAVDPPSGRRTHQSKKITASVMTSALLVAALAPLAAQPANAATSDMGPISDLHGFPEWFSDGEVALELCYEAGKGCLAEPPNPALPPSYPDNFPEEAFWFAAEASSGKLGLYEAALEAAHVNEVPAVGDQMGFGRLRFRLDSLQPNADYTITHPYGIHTFTADAAGVINVTLDEGCAGDPCDWNQVAQGFLGDYAAGISAAFIKQIGAPAGTIGEVANARPVTGAPSGFNYVEVVGPDIGGPGINSLRVDTFGIQGVIADVVNGAPSTPNLTDASDTGRSPSDNITNVNLPTFTGKTTAGASVDLLVDDVVAASGTAGADGSFSLTPATPLADGAHAVRAQIPDPATPGAFLKSAALNIHVDTVAPAASVVAPLPSNPTADDTPTLHFTSEANARFECQLLPSNPIFAPCTSPHTYDQQLNGDYTFNVRATDVAGNAGANASYSWRIGPAAPPPPPPAAEQKDMNGDGNPDLVARDSGGRLWLYPSTSAGGFGTRVQIGSGWGSMNAILQPGDFNGDGHSDIMARDTSGRLWLYTGTGTGRINGGVQIGSGWGGMTALVTPGDFNGDRKVDLLARDSGGRLYLYPGNGAGGWGTRTQPGSGWGGFTAILSTGDFSGDGRSDVIARTSGGALWLYRGNGTGGFGTANQIGAGWNGFTLTGPGAWGTADAHSDLVARDSAGALWLYRGSGTGGFIGSRTQIGGGWGGFTIVQ